LSLPGYCFYLVRRREHPREQIFRASSALVTVNGLDCGVAEGVLKLTPTGGWQPRARSSLHAAAQIPANFIVNILSSADLPTQVYYPRPGNGKSQSRYGAHNCH